MSESKNTELTDFVYDVLNSTLDAILNARMDQERQYFELVEDALLSPEEFVEKYNLKKELEDNLAGEVIETSDFDQLLAQIYEDRQRLLNRLIEEGPPKLKVQEGNLKIKMAFAVEEEDPAITANQQAIQQMRKPAAVDPVRPVVANRVAMDPRLKQAASVSMQRFDHQVKQKQLYRQDKRKIKIALPEPGKELPTNGGAYGELSIKFSLE